jgi:hypothetical protein
MPNFNSTFSLSFELTYPLETRGKENGWGEIHHFYLVINVTHGNRGFIAGTLFLL